MHVADIFELPNDFDPEPLQASARHLTSDLRREAEGLAARLLARSALETQAVALTLFLLGGGARRRVDPPTRALHRIALLCLAIEQHRAALFEASSSDQVLDLDLATLQAIARGEPSEIRGPLGEYLAGARALVEGLPGWSDGAASFTAALLGLLDGVVQEHRMRAQARDRPLGSTWDGAICGSALELLIETANIALGDKTRRTHDRGANLVSRLSTGIVGLAADQSHFERGHGNPQAMERISQRFAIPAHVIRLDTTELRRALRATLSLELRDLIDATQYLPADEPRSGVVRRAVTATVERQNTASALLAAYEAVQGSPSRADVMGQMRRAAGSTRSITSEQRELLRGMDAHLFGFQVLLDHAERDTVLDFDEFQQLRTQRQQILDDLFRIALADDKITYEERKLLLKAMELLPTLRGAL